MPEGTKQKLSAKTHQKCIVCGKENNRGLKIDYKLMGPDSVSATFQCQSCFESYRGMVHGGVITSILDGAMLHCLFFRGLTAVTIDMNTKFRHPLLSGTDAKVSARLDSRHGPVYFLSADIVQRGKVAANATARFYNKPDLKE